MNYIRDQRTTINQIPPTPTKAKVGQLYKIKNGIEVYMLCSIPANDGSIKYALVGLASGNRWSDLLTENQIKDELTLRWEALPPGTTVTITTGS